MKDKINLDSIIMEKRSLMVNLIRCVSIEGFDEETGGRTITALNIGDALTALSADEFAARIENLKSKENQEHFQVWHDEEQALQTIISNLTEENNFSAMLSAIEDALLKRRAEFEEDSINMSMICGRLENIQLMFELLQKNPDSEIFM